MLWLGFLHYAWVHLRVFGATLVIAWTQHSLIWSPVESTQRKNESLSINWTTICLVMLDFFFFSLIKSSVLSHSFSLLSLDALRYAHRSWSPFYVVHLSCTWYLILWLIHLIPISTRCLSFSSWKGERHAFTFTFFLEIHFYHLIISFYRARIESWVKCSQLEMEYSSHDSVVLHTSIILDYC